MINPTRNILLIAHNLRSCHNVGSLLRTADGLGVKSVHLTGYTPYPKSENDTRLPHIAKSAHSKIAKTALGAEKSVDWNHHEDALELLSNLKLKGYQLVAVEQTPGSTELPEFKPASNLALIIGRETEGIEPEVLSLCDVSVEIPMLGQKESYNVTIAAAIALYHCTFS